MRLFPIVVLLLPNMAFAQTMSLGPALSTLGGGLEGTARLSDHLVIRSTVNGAAFDTDDEIDSVDYEIEASLLSFGLIGDYHPFANGFRLSAGARLNLNEADVEASPNSAIEIGGTTYTPAEIGTLNGNVGFNQVAPYIGLGYDNSLFGADNFFFRFDLGLHYQGDADVSLSAADGTLASDPAFLDDVEREREALEDELDVFGFFPVVALGFSYRF